MSKVEEFELELEKYAAIEINQRIEHGEWIVEKNSDETWSFILNEDYITGGYSKLNAMKNAICLLRQKTEPCINENYEIVDHPKHYGGAEAKHEAISVIEEWSLGFHLGNVVKYISRAGKKPDQTTISDLKKARWYLDRYIGDLEANNVADSEE